MKTVVCRWRVSSKRIAALRIEARRENIPLTRLLNRITTQWLSSRRNLHTYAEADQAAIRRQATAAIGSIRGGDPTRSRRASQFVREIIMQKRRAD